MNADDERHGTTAGYWAGCRELCCRRAAAEYERRRLTRRYIKRGPLMHPGEGVRRRIQALMALGWTSRQIDDAIGQKRTYTTALLRNAGRPVNENTAAKIHDAYDRMCMVLPPTNTSTERMNATRVRKYAAKMGWAPPLAWDDIDTDPHPQWGGTDTDIDPVVVMRLLEGRRIESTKAEKEEAMRRWVLDGGSQRELAQIHGWKPERYTAGLRLVKGGAA